MKSLKPDNWQKGSSQQEFESETNSKDEEKSKVYYFFWGLVVSIACLWIATSFWGSGLHYFIYGNGSFPIDSYFVALILNAIVVTRWIEFIENGCFSDTNDSMESRTINPGDSMYGIGGDNWDK